MNKRILSLLLAIVMVLGVCAAGFTAFAANVTYTSISATRHTKSEEGKADVTENHTLEYTYNGNGTHTVSCKYCDYSVIALCSGNSKCVCGATVKFEKIVKTETDETGAEKEITDIANHKAIINGVEYERAHRFANGLCTDCGFFYSCESLGHDIGENPELYASELEHSYVCVKCNSHVYYNDKGELEAVKIGTDGSVTPATAAHTDTGVAPDESCLNEQRYCMVCNEKHAHKYVKTSNQEAKCEQFPFDIYKCIQCGHQLSVKLGDQLGHYWPVKLDENENPVYVDANGNKISEDSSVEKYLVPDDRYITVEWGDNNESCTITMTCMRPTCDYGHNQTPQTISYSVYTKRNNEVGKIVKENYDAPACKESSTTYTAYFKIPNVPKVFEAEFIYYRAETKKVTTPATAAHSKGDVISSKAPTCTEDGKTTYKCAECGEAFSVTTPATGHNLGEAVVVRAATCSAEGLSEAKCQNDGCMYSETKTIAKTEHKVGAEEKIEATCTERGGTAVECEICHYKKYSEATTPALGHDYSVRDSDSEGNTWLKCSRCGEKKATLCNGNHNDTKYDIDFDRVCDVCGGKIAFAPNALHYIVGIPQFWMRVVFRMLIGGDWKAMFITRSK